MINKLLYKIKLKLPASVKAKMMPLVPKLLIRSLKSDDYIIISFPKCGRSWLKLILCDMVYYQFPKTSRIDDVSTELLYKVGNGIPRIIFTHDQNPMYKTVHELSTNKVDYSMANVAFLVRDPRDVIVSWFFEYKFRVSDESKQADMNDDNLSAFLRNERGGLPTIVAFYNIWMKERRHMRNFMMLKYEDLRTTPHETIKRLIGFLKIDKVIHEEAILKAIETNSFKNVQNREKEGRIINGKNKAKEFGAGNNNALKARKGKVGGYKDSLTQQDIDWVDEYIKKHLDPSFGY